VPTWQAVLQRAYAAWDEPHLVVDTAGITPQEAVAVVERYIGT
jgi:hypothetical protein